MCKTLAQGDLISLGAVSIVGKGPSELLVAADAEADDEQLWALTAESDVGWYVILSQDCDVVRHPDIEPALLVCPLVYRTAKQHGQLRHGPYSPREFPFPTDKLKPPAGLLPVADVRVVTSLAKTALLVKSVDTLRPLTGGQRERFTAWVGRRFARAAHDDLVDRDVLGPSGETIRSVIAKATKAIEGGKVPTASGRLCLSVNEWRISGNDRHVILHAVLSESSLADANLWGVDEPDHEAIEAGRSWLETNLAKKLPNGGGYTLELHVTTLTAMTAAAYRATSPWVFDHPGDPLTGS